MSEIASYTKKQGQYLAFIYTYTLLHDRPPAESDMQGFFGTTPPSVHRMVVELHRKRLISRIPGAPRSIQLVVDPSELPRLERPSNRSNSL